MSDICNLANLEQQIRIADAAVATLELGRFQVGFAAAGTIGLLITIALTLHSQIQARQALKLSEKSLASQRKVAHAQLRGYVGISYVSMSKTESDEAIVTLKLRNFGHTPVLVNHLEANVQAVDARERIECETPKAQTPLGGFELAPGEGHDILLPTSYYLNPENEFRMSAPLSWGGIELRATARVDYTDYLNVSHWVQFGAVVGYSTELPEIRRWLEGQNSSDRNSNKLRP